MVAPLLPELLPALAGRSLTGRDLLAFPGGDNETDTVFGGVHFNLTTLRFWNYTYYSNQTLSNGTKCWLTFPPYQPHELLTNGTFVNATKCWTALDPIGTRGVTGIVFAALYGLGLVMTLAALAKHGALYLPKEKRFFPIGRRWQWYWGGFVGACALIGLLSNIDIDRYYVQELPIVLTSFFWFLLCQGTMALTWEAVRHWGSWLERQYVDPNPFIYRQDDRRAMIEFWMPLWFYFWVWMNFFLVVPRSWKFAEKQRSPDQTRDVAIPAATGGRFKGAAVCLVIAWLTILFSLRHSVQHYKPRNRGLANRVVGLARALPVRFMFMIPLCLAMIIYQIVIAFVWDLSVMRYRGVVPIIFAWGYGPPLLIMYIQLAYGFFSPNEDKELMRQRRERGETINRELGIVKKPAWWRRVRGDHLQSLRDKIKRNVSEVGGERGVGRRVEDDVERHARLEAERNALIAGDGVIELGSVAAQDDDINGDGGRSSSSPESGGQMPKTATTTTTTTTSLAYAGKSDRRHAERIRQAVAGVLFPGAAGAASAETERARRAAYLAEDGSPPPPPPPYTDAGRREAEDPRAQMAGSRTVSSSTTVSSLTARSTVSSSTANSANAPEQRVRSMLDI